MMGKLGSVENSLSGSLGAAIRTSQSKRFIKGAVGGMRSSCGCPGADEQTETEERDGPGRTWGRQGDKYC